MKKILIITLAVIMTTSAAALADVMDFEDFYQGTQTYAAINNFYHGFTMGADNWYITKNLMPGSGYEYGTTGNVSMFSNYARPIILSSSTDFSVQSFDLTSAWNSSETVIIQGWKSGHMIHSDDVTAYNTGATPVSLNYTGIDTLQIIPTSRQILVDNLVCNFPQLNVVAVPLPSSLILMGMGLLRLTAFRFRRN
jgi:hypothetical protein